MIGGMTEMIKRHYYELKSAYTHIDVEELSNLVNRSVYFSKHEQPLEDLFDNVQAVVMNHSLHISHPGAMAHLHCPPIIPALAAEVMISALNQSMDSWDQSPAATYIEDKVIDELTQQIGYPSSSSGILQAEGRSQIIWDSCLLVMNIAILPFQWMLVKKAYRSKLKLRIFCSEKRTLRCNNLQLSLGWACVQW